MIVTDLQRAKRNPKRWSVYIDGDFTFAIDEVDMLFCKIAIGQEITEERLEYLKTEVLLAKARDKAARFLGAGIRTEFELSKKLEEDGYPSGVIEQTLELMEKIGYLDDLKTALEYIRIRFDAGYGASKIEWDLEQKGVSSEVSCKAFEASGYSEDEALQRALSLKTRTRAVESMDPKERKRLFDYLMRRGFPAQMASEALKCASLCEDGFEGGE